MLVQFTVGNYRSFQEPVTLSLLAANLDHTDDLLVQDNTFIAGDELKLLKATAIYGANASGKSNLAKAIDFVKWFMMNSFTALKPTDKIHAEPFRLDVKSERNPSCFEIVFFVKNRRYRYGFEVTQDRVISEWLYDVPKRRKSTDKEIYERELFFRQGDTIRIPAKQAYMKGGIVDRAVLKKFTRANALFISVSAQLNVKVADDILTWVTYNLNITSGSQDYGYSRYTIRCLANNNNKLEILNLIRKLDLGIDHIEINQTELSSSSLNLDSLLVTVPDVIKDMIIQSETVVSTDVITSHRKIDHDGNLTLIEQFKLTEHESEGTQKVFAFSGPLIETLKKGGVMIIDEFDASLHPVISLAIIRLFNSQETNPNNAQLVFMTHDTNLLDQRVLRRDQIWFTEKNRYGITDLYSLAEYKSNGSNEDLEENYIQGRYGAVPYLRDLSNILNPS